MDLQDLVNQLRAERTRIDQAIAALEGTTSKSNRRPGRPPKAGKRRHMSAAARKRISAAMKQRWAKWKGKSAPTKVKGTPKKRGRRTQMSAAAKKHLSELMKARWAERKARA